MHDSQRNARKINLLNGRNERVCSLETGGLSEYDLVDLMDWSSPRFDAETGALACGELMLRGRIDLVGFFLEQNRPRISQVIDVVMKNVWEYFISQEKKASFRMCYPNEVKIIERRIRSISSLEGTPFDIPTGISVST